MLMYATVFKRRIVRCVSSLLIEPPNPDFAHTRFSGRQQIGDSTGD
ncbi:hypothetical protein SLEP1_g16638 [Rubroshorea leprosula]|uniref:Ycf15 n=1 Tax=Rubroshorea leprosula TaxID=152421 RepID=A0AAV5J0K4_9ROSI|nr:hypothetical protein SLEP1_g16638 [Rubroshorea leprosula]